MKTCEKFARIQAQYTRETTYLLNHATSRRGTRAANLSAGLARASRNSMAKSLSTHVSNCLICG
ncbi:hypothetical protein [Streptomyces sp. NPDC056632]|uniref:hypothetical protein n=1 Tax=Streptomyces sp. NPDC056632 TaxID=3345884 RepID=UPI00369C7E77